MTIRRGRVLNAGRGPCKPKSTALSDQGAHHSPSILSTNSQRRILMPANQVICGTSANIGHESMIRKSGNRFSEKIMLKQKDEIMMRLNLIGSWARFPDPDRENRCRAFRI